MNWLFRRHFWVINLVFLSIVAAILAKTFTTVLGYWASKKIPEKPMARAFIPSEEAPALKNFEIASERNLFAAQREQVNFSDEDEMEGADSGRWEDAGPSGLPIKLISTMIFTDPFSSRAEILEMSSGRAQNFSIGECEEYQKQNTPDIETVLDPESWELERPCNEVFGLARIVRIEEFRVYILNHRTHRYEFISLIEGDTGPRERLMLRAEGEETGTGVRKIGATSYEIDQREFDKAMTNVATLLTEARAVIEKDSTTGEQVGFKIAYLKEGSLFEKIGIEREDILTRINGFDLNSPEKALQLFSKLRTANQFTIDLKRAGRSVTLDYSVVR